MQLKHAVAFGAVAVVALAIFTVSSSAPKSHADDTTESLRAIEQSVHSIAGAYSLIAADIHAMRVYEEAARATSEEDAHAMVVERQNLADAVIRLTVRLDAMDRRTP